MQAFVGPKHVQAAYHQLKLGKDFLKQFSKAIGKMTGDIVLAIATLCRHRNTFSFTANTIQRREED
jgi:hypothetical protein